jgi:hypothetical protein
LLNVTDDDAPEGSAQILDAFDFDARVGKSAGDVRGCEVSEIDKILKPGPAYAHGVLL